ncbi:LytR/AlgR family response regulator transcription factor [Emticicia sp. SJ17W-69]|uniref:LytR/AlgR family response regulator transcription factor n=1 Tax=Emticicia sp. SJ17W-69 TaxID=3421657 RepID=UPI003EBB44FF
MKSLFISVYNKKKVKVDSNNIVYLQAQINYTKIFLIDETSILVAKTLKSFEREFQGQDFYSFYRSNKTFIVNLDKIQNVEEIDNVLQIQLSNSIKVSVSRRKRKAFISNFRKSTSREILMKQKSI